jgi:hypothetical protein
MVELPDRARALVEESFQAADQGHQPGAERLEDRRFGLS